eukprot:573147-Pelagomonas_calceolata.AAC.10
MKPASTRALRKRWNSTGLGLDPSTRKKAVYQPTNTLASAAQPQVVFPYRNRTVCERHNLCGQAD